ncbi:MAG: DNA polymerase, partial [Defluviitaleaceae bacterium]|nr:DNA polymerase [Defluviitaleaceae bacterium]
MKLLLFDGFSILNRAFYALPPLTNSAGEFTNAIYGFLNIFFRFVDEEKPEHVIVAFDLPQPTFRHEMFGAYKGTRKGMPDELRAQVPALKTLLQKMGVVLSECAGYEADDIIGTLAKKAAAQEISPVIITGDRDLLQLASEKIKIRLPKTKSGKTEIENYDDKAVFEKYGVSPEAFVDVKALMGDASDNIPGVPGIGEVTATKIIAAYGSLENAIANVDEIRPKKASENLSQFREQAILSRRLAAIALDAPVELQLAQNNFFNDDAFAEIKRLELKSLYKKFSSGRGVEEISQKKNPFEKIKTQDESLFEEINTRIEENISFEIVKSRNEAQNFFENLCDAAFFSLWDSGENPFLVGVSVATHDATKYFHIGGALTLDGGENFCETEIFAMIKPWLESDAQKFLHDSKNEITRFAKFKISPQNITFDAMLASYVLNSLADDDFPDIEELLDNKGKRSQNRKTVSDLPEKIAAEFSAHAARKIFVTRIESEKILVANNQEKLFREIELPLARLLAEIEAAGIGVDKNILLRIGAETDARIAALTALIYDIAGEEFNINSPAQLGEILFTKLGLRGGKKTQKGFSTAADVLEKLSSAHVIIPLILEYRANTKLKSTYIDGMIPLARTHRVHMNENEIPNEKNFLNEKNNYTHEKIIPNEKIIPRIYTTFHQALTATGRLSSAEPNLQNIPVRTELGRELRKAFVPAEGCVFVDADYSQIELRLLAHMSGDEGLIRAFRDNLDIHTQTAAQVFSVAPEEVSQEQRTAAKAVNFGIVYGISAFGLSEDLKIP